MNKRAPLEAIGFWSPLPRYRYHWANPARLLEVVRWIKGRHNYNRKWVHPKWLVDPTWQASNHAAIVRYLRSGVLCGAECGYSYCRFADGPPDKEMGAGEQSDGVWFWPQGLVVYVERYHVRLPEEFVAHMIQNGFQIPAGLQKLDLFKRGQSFEFWDRWCARVRPGWKQRIRSMLRTWLGRKN